MRLDLLVAATNDVLKLGNSASAADLWKSFLICCKVLHMLEEDERFFQQVEDSAAGQLPDFEAFLRVEEKCLIDAGVEREVAQALARQARDLRVTARHWHDSPKDIRVQVRKLCNETCEAADQLKRLAACRT